MNAQKILQAKYDYFSYFTQLENNYKSFTYTEKFNHFSGITIEATATVKMNFDLHAGYAHVYSNIIPTINPVNSGWLKLNKQPSGKVKVIPLEDFLNLPDFTGEEKLSYKIV